MKRTLLAAVALLALLAAGGYAVYGQTEPGASAPDRQRFTRKRTSLATGSRPRVITTFSSPRSARPINSSS